MKLALRNLGSRAVFPLILLAVGFRLITWSYPLMFSLRYQLQGERILMPIFIETQSTSSGLCSEAIAQAMKVDQLKVEQAIYYLHLSQTYAPNSASSLLLAKTYCWLGDLEEATSVLQQYDGLYPNHLFGRLEWWRSLGHGFQDKKKWDEAVQVYEHALVEFPDVPDLHVNLGVALYRRGDGLSAAMQEIKRAISIKPVGSFYTNMGQLLTEERRYEEADTWYRMGINAEPDSPWGYQVWAGNAMQANNVAEALSRYQIIIERFPDFSPSYFDMAWAYRLNGQAAGAIQSIERAVSLVPSPDPWYFIRAGEIYEWAGQIEKAKESYRQALALAPANESAIQGINRLSGQLDNSPPPQVPQIQIK